MTERRRGTGRRVQPRAAAAARRTAQAGRRGGRREERPRPGERRRLRQMAVSAVILLAVVICKLAAPGTAERYRVKVLTLLGEDTDFAAAFSAVGRAVSGQGELGDTLNDAYVAVFGPREVTAEDGGGAETLAGGGTVCTAENTPGNVCLIQQVLGFPYAAPVEGAVTDRFGLRDGGDFHYGVDIAADSGAVIRAFAAGTVTVVGESPELGKYVTVYHGGDYATLYAHCSRITASSGQQVALGDPIAEVGQTGNATGPHLHFELTRDTVYLNPVYYVGR